MRRVADDLLRTLRDAFLQANASGRVPYDGAPRRVRAARRAREGAWATPRSCARIEILGEAIVDIRGQAVADPRLVLEVAVVRIARREARTREETLLDRVERLEQRLGDGGATRRADCRAGRRAGRAAAPGARAGRTDARPPRARGEADGRRSGRADADRARRHAAAETPAAAAPAEASEPTPPRRRSRSTT